MNRLSIKVLIVDDSIIFRTKLQLSLSQDKEIEVVGSAINAKDAMGKIEELGELAAFLACEESSYITGQGIVIDGGSTLPETATMGV